METRTLRWFQLVVDGATLTEVSEIERVSQPAISRALARLEEEVGAPLLRKHGRMLRPTAAGAAFKRQVDEMLHRLDDGLAAASQAVDPETGIVQLGFQPSLATWLVPLLIRSFTSRHAAVGFSLKDLRGDQAREGLEMGAVDLVIGTRRLPRDRTHRLRLMDQPLGLVVAPDHRLAARKSISLVEAADDTFLMLPDSTSLGALSRQLCAASGFEPRVGFEGGELSTLRGFVAAGLGVAILPKAGGGWLDGLSSPLRHVPVTDANASQEISITWSAAHRLLPSAELFVQHVSELSTAGRLPVAASADEIVWRD